MNELDRLIEILCEERGEPAPHISDEEKADYFRALCNVRPPMPVTEEFLRLQDAYLTKKKYERGITDVNSLRFAGGITLFKGDITTLNADAVVNAANTRMLGCFQPLHNCIDNVIHSAAGVRVRLDCNDIMKGKCAQNGEVIVTSAYNLPSKYIFHTAGPIISGKVTPSGENDLAKCYRNCIIAACEKGAKTLAFCCISTGVFGYPKNEAARVAVQTVKTCLESVGKDCGPKVIFNVFTEEDYEIYRRLLGKDGKTQNRA